MRVTFIARKRVEDVPARRFNTARGEIRVSTPEATAIDLAGYPRPGYLLELAEAASAAGALKNYVRERAREYTPLMPGAASEDAQRNADWKIIINAVAEAEL